MPDIPNILKAIQAARSIAIKMAAIATRETAIPKETKRHTNDIIVVNNFPPTPILFSLYNGRSKYTI